MRCLYGCDKDITLWVKQRLEESNLDPCHAIGVVDNDNNIIAGVVYNEYRKVDMRLHVASDNHNWATRDIISELLSYPFIHLGCNRITAVIREGNQEAIKFDEGIGFIYEGTVRKGYKTGENLLIYGMLFEDFVESKYAPKYETLNPKEIVPIHEAWNEEKLNDLIDSMENVGWKGRPLVVLRTDRNYAMTGTHRRAAAEKVGLQVPVHYVKSELFKDEMFINMLFNMGDIQSAKYLQIELENFRDG